MPNKQAVIPLFGRGFTSKSPTVTAQLLTNMYREPIQDADKTAMAFYATPGLTFNFNFADPFFIKGDMPCRGAITISNMTWAVFGQWVVAFGTSTGPGGTAGMNTGFPLSSTSGRVGMAHNGSQLIIVDGVNGHYCDLIPNDGGPLSGSFDCPLIAAAGFPNGATVVDFLNGFFIVDNPNGIRPGQFNWSGLYSATTWSSLDFANAESSPDSLVQIKVKAGQIYLFGTSSYEVWSATGDARFFARVGGTGAEWGCAAKWSVVDYGDNTLALLAKNRLGQFMPVKVVGYNVEPIGGHDPEIVNSMNQTSAGQATAYSYSIDAHSFYQVNFGDRSYLFDNLSSAWSRISSDGGRHYGEIRVDSTPIGAVPGLPFVFDYRKPTLYQQNPLAYTDAGTPIINTLVSKHVFADYGRINIAELYIDFEVGTADVPGSAPTPLSGHGLPLGSVGNVGDYYIDLDTGILYGPKASGTVVAEHGAPDGLVSTGGGGVFNSSVGAWLTFAVAGTITHVRYGRSSSTYDTSRNVAIYNTALTTALATGFVANDGGGTKWVEAPLSVPLHVTAGQTVVATWHTDGNIPTTPTGWQQATVTFPISNGGNVSISKGLRGAGIGVMLDISPGYPFADVVFVADSALWPVASGLPLRAPQVMLDWSKDGGRTFGNQITQSLGNIGQYQTRARWQNLGIARDWVFRLSFSENNKLVITNAAVRVS